MSFEESGYAVFEKINQGSQGCIYRGIELESKENVIMKKISKEKGLERIKNEIKANEMLNDEEGTCIFHGHIDTADDVVSQFVNLFTNTDANYNVVVSHTRACTRHGFIQTIRIETFCAAA
jgi:serine/threonine protein kinase